MKILLIGTSGKLGFEIYRYKKGQKECHCAWIRRKKFNLSYKIIYLNF